jgi:hypothetical protein
MTDFKKQVDFVKQAQIDTGFESALESNEQSTLDQALDESKDQALVVGSEIISFAAGVKTPLRESVANSALLAQLVANNKVTNQENVTAWYEVYFDSLQRLGWAVQEKNFSVHDETGTDFETHKAILAVAATVFGSAATALAIITSTLNALQDVSGTDKKWLTIFKRESQKAKVARFQISVAEPLEDGVVLSLMAFKLEAQSKLTQVLFFKVKKTDVKLEHSSGKVTLAEGLLETLRPVLSKKVAKHAVDWIDALGDIPVTV